MRYRGTIYIDVYAENRADAEDELLKIVLGLKGSFMGDVSPLPHGSSLNLQEKTASSGDSLISGEGNSLKSLPTSLKENTRYGT